MMEYMGKKLLREVVLKKTDGKCFLCGEALQANDNDSSLEHFIPRAVYKWIPVEWEELKYKLESEDNLFLVHQKCNLEKDSSLPNIKIIQAMLVEPAIKESLLKLYRSVEVYLNQYRAIKQSILHKQRHRCVFCRKYISMNTSTLRRKNNNLIRCKENGMCLCLDCSIKVVNTRIKNKMLKKAGLSI